MMMMMMTMRRRRMRRMTTMVLVEWFAMCRAHFSAFAKKGNVYELTCHFFVYHQSSDGVDKDIFVNFPPLRRRGSYESKNWKIARKIQRHPHVGNCTEIRQ